MVRKELEEARVKLYHKKDRTRIVIGVGATMLVVFLLIAILNAIDSIDVTLRPGDVPPKRFLTWLVLAIAGFTGPYGFYVARKQKNIKQVERRLPEFLRDVAEAGRFGMTLAEAIEVASSGRYGKLTPEIKKMAAQISWGVPATEALRLFATRVDTPMVNRVVSIIVKSSDAGGDVADVLAMVSHDAKEAQLTEDERKIVMSTYIAVIYISFLVFLVTIWILNVTFLPQIRTSGEQLETQIAATGTGGQIESPLAKNIESVILGLQLAFFIAAMVHATGDGILAGVLDNGKVANGLRHSFLMLLIALISFQLI
ncbi:MAG: type II secretion system F family protein [Candidatus Thermoplasmatota archaeon]